jgi:hypothetical protein
MAANVAFSEGSSRLVLNTLSQSTGTITKGTFTAGGTVIPTTLYLAILTGVPTDDTGTGLVEFTGYSGYATSRPTIAFNTAATGTASTAQKITGPSSGTVTYTITTAGPTSINGIAVCCHPTAALSMANATGNVLWYGDLSSVVSVVATDVLTFNTTSITIDLY